MSRKLRMDMNTGIAQMSRILKMVEREYKGGKFILFKIVKVTEDIGQVDGGEPDDPLQARSPA